MNSVMGVYKLNQTLLKAWNKNQTSFLNKYNKIKKITKYLIINIILYKLHLVKIKSSQYLYKIIVKYIKAKIYRKIN